ncbi:MAG TPA: IS1595 family transposase [Xanthobacteraceae bacterium]|nr:IS1595 family transposase [Xanthobacteraceae bacterium]
MQSSVLDAKHFHDEEAAFAYLEARLWPNGPICPHCGGVERVGKLKGKSTRVGVWKCYQCRKPFRATVGTVFESSHVPLRLWLQCVHLMASSKKGISSNQLHRTLGVTLKTAWFMAHRVREAMRVLGMEPMGGAGKIVEADETYIGTMEGHAGQRVVGGAVKNMVVTLVERGGSARSFHADGHSVATIVPIMRENIRRETRLMTDRATHYFNVGKEYAEHGRVAHEQNEYVRGDIHTNTVEGFYSIFKRGMKGVYQHCKEKHLHRYLAEFDFRYSNRVGLGVSDVGRADRALKGIVGKRLTYQTPRH